MSVEAPAPPADEEREAPTNPAGPLWWVTRVVGVLLLVGALAALIARLVPVTNHALLIFSALSPYLMFGAVLALALLVLTRKRGWTAMLALTTIAGALCVEMPQFIGPTDPPADPCRARILTVNLFEGRADPYALARIARERTDLLLLQELTPEVAEALNREGLGEEFPYQAVDARPGALGVGIWSRYPLSRHSQVEGYELGMIRASMHFPAATTETEVLVAHIAGPWPQPVDAWSREMNMLPKTLDEIASENWAKSIVVAGDFNSTLNMQQFRGLLNDGYRDAAEQSGAGVVRTYPADRWYPPLIGIDHVLTRNGSADGLYTVRVPGSDHLGVGACVHLPA